MATVTKGSLFVPSYNNKVITLIQTALRYRLSSFRYDFVVGVTAFLFCNELIERFLYEDVAATPNSEKGLRIMDLCN